MDCMDYLAEILKLQDQLQSKLLIKYRYAFSNNQDYIIKNARWAQDELSELVSALKSYDKPWKHGEVEMEEVKEEAIDALHFLLNVFLALEMNAKEIFKIYARKNEENYKRFLGIIR